MVLSQHENTKAIETKEMLLQKELAHIIPPIIRSAVQEKFPEIVSALANVSTKPQEVELEVHNYRYISIATSPFFDESVRQRMAAENSSSVSFCSF